jgi:hypothetical protein
VLLEMVAHQKEEWQDGRDLFVDLLSLFDASR